MPELRSSTMSGPAADRESVRPANGSPDVIVVEGLERHYGALQAVRDVSLTVRAGEIFALVGPNGAGKTTTVEILEGHRRRSGGRVSVLGYDPETGGRDLRERIGIVLQEAGFDEEFRVDELVRFYTGFYPRRRDVDELIDLVGLGDKRTAKVTTLSGGQRRRLDLALGLAGCPEVLFLDEPTTGFDPSARRRAWDLVASLRGSGTTVLLTTHYLDEAEYLADRVAVLAAGRIVALGSPAHLQEQAAREATIRCRLPGTTAAADLPAFDGAARLVADTLEISTAAPTQDLQALTTWAVNRGIVLDALSVGRPTLEEVYLQLVGDQPQPDDAGGPSGELAGEPADGGRRGRRARHG